MRTNPIDGHQSNGLRRALSARNVMAGLLGVTLASSALAFTASSSSAETSSRTVEMASPSTEATAADETQDRKIDFCHKNENQPNYVFLSLPIPGVMGHISETAHKDDIIPSFTYTDKDSKQEVTFPGRNLDKSDYIGRDCKGKDGEDDWNDVPTWVTISGIVTCHLVGGVNDGTWDITWTAQNSSPSGKKATVTGVEPANATPQSAEIPSGGSKDFLVNATTAGAQTLVLKDVDFSEPGKGPSDRSYSGSTTIDAGSCVKPSVPTTPATPPATPGGGTVAAPAVSASAAATPSATPSATASASATPIVTPEPAVTETPEPTVITPEAATAPTVVNAGDGSSAPRSGLAMWAMALAVVAAIGAAGAGLRLAVFNEN